MVSGTLYTYNGSQRAYQILIAAAYGGSDVKVDEKFEFGKTNTSDDFLKKFPLGKVPAFEDSNGNCLTETTAIASYVSNEALRGGSNPVNQALVQQFVSFAENEILPSACTWTFPTLGFRHYNKQDTEKAMTHIKKCFKLLDDLLLTRTFVVGERVTLADIALCCSMITLYVQVLDPKFRQSYGNVNRWFLTCINQPNFKKILGDITLCSQMAQFDSKKYNELHPKQGKGGKQEKPKAEKKVEKKKEEKKTEEAPPPKKVDYFADVPKSEMRLDDWKVRYANADDLTKLKDSFSWLWENFDSNAYSIWQFDYKHPEDYKMTFLAGNLMQGFLQRTEGLRKHSHCMAGVYETTVNGERRYAIHGVWIFKGTTLAFERCADWQVDYESFDWKKLDASNKDDQAFVEYAYSLDEDNFAKGKRLPTENEAYYELR